MISRCTFCNCEEPWKEFTSADGALNMIPPPPPWIRRDDAFEFCGGTCAREYDEMKLVGRKAEAAFRTNALKKRGKL